MENEIEYLLFEEDGKVYPESELLNELFFSDILRRSKDKRAPIAKQFQIEAAFHDVDTSDFIVTFYTQDLGPQGSRQTHITQFQINKRLDPKRWITAQRLYLIRDNRPALTAFVLNGFVKHGHVNFYCSCECFTGDTLVKMLDGTDRRMDELVKGEEYWIYSSDENGNFIPKKATALGVTKTVNQLVEVTLDNGSIERCSLNHKWRMRDGSYKEAHLLEAGDSLLPLYTDIDKKGYEFIKVASIRILDVEPTDLYDIYVPDTHNFALSSGVYVHNSFIYGGFAYMATKEKSNIIGHKEQRPPKKNNPNLYGVCCKHIAGIVANITTFSNAIVDALQKELQSQNANAPTLTGTGDTNTPQTGVGVGTTTTTAPTPTTAVPVTPQTPQTGQPTSSTGQTQPGTTTTTAPTSTSGVATAPPIGTQPPQTTQTGQPSPTGQTQPPANGRSATDTSPTSGFPPMGPTNIQPTSKGHKTKVHHGHHGKHKKHKLHWIKLTTDLDSIDVKDWLKNLFHRHHHHSDVEDSNSNIWKRLAHRKHLGEK